MAELAAGLVRAEPAFPRRRFERAALARFPDLELKARIHHLVDLLGDHLPPAFPAALDVLRAALPPPLDPTRSDDDFGRFIWVVPGEYAVRHGCTPEHHATALDFLHTSTQRFSAEFAIRPFLRAFPDATLDRVRQWTGDPNYHVRRLASEGIRPFLPWGERVVLPVAMVVDVLDRLHGDPTRYVTRSVANTLNDLSKLDPDAVLDTVGRWQRAGRQAPDELRWMTRHALRTLLKADHPGALAAEGYANPPSFRLSGINCPGEVPVGGHLVWRATLLSQAAQRLRIALRIHYRKANGRLAPRVFKVADRDFAAGERLAIEQRQSFRPMTTRTLYPGEHAVELVVNGVARGRRAFAVVA